VRLPVGETLRTRGIRTVAAIPAAGSSLSSDQRRLAANNPLGRIPENSMIQRSFGPWEDPQDALEKWLEQKDDLLARPRPRPKVEGLTVAEYRVRTEGRDWVVDESRLRASGAENRWFHCPVGSAVAASTAGGALPAPESKEEKKQGRIQLPGLQRLKRYGQDPRDRELQAVSREE